MFPPMMVMKQNRIVSFRPHIRSRYRHASGSVTTEMSSYSQLRPHHHLPIIPMRCTTTPFSTFVQVEPGRTSTMLSSTKPALKKVQGNFQLNPGTMTNHGNASPIGSGVGGVGEFSRTSVSSAKAMIVVRIVVRVRIRVPIGTVWRKGRNEIAGIAAGAWGFDGAM